MTEQRTPLAEAADRAFAAKSARRRELARLPIEEKVRIVALLQRQANEIRRASGRPLMPEWPIPSERESQ